MTKIMWTFLFSSFFVVGAFAEPTTDAASQQGFRIDAEVRTEAYLSVQQHGGPDYKISESHIELRLENEDFKKILSTFHIPQDGVTAITSFSVRFSGVPYLMGDYTKGKLESQLNAQLNAFRQAEQPLIAAQVNEAIAKNPATNQLPAAEKELLAEQFIAAANKTLDKKLAAARAQNTQQEDSRLSDIQLETAIQEVALSIGGVVGDGTAMIFLRAGKFRIDDGPQTDVDGNSEVDNIRHVPNRIERNAGTMGTGAIDLGTIKNFSDDVHLRADVYFFHNRIPYITGNEVLADALSMTDAQYHAHKQWWKLDSQALRALLETKQIDLYVGAANLDGGGSVVAGTVLRITESDKVFVDLTAATRQLGAVKQGASVFYAHQIRPEISVYTGLTYVHDSDEPLISATPVSYLEPALGVSWDLLHKEIWKWDVKAGVGTELFYREYSGGDHPRNEIGERVGGYLQASPATNNPVVKTPLF